jgi:hypothetical protein
MNKLEQLAKFSKNDELLKKLSEHSNYKLKLLVASNKHASSDLLERLFEASFDKTIAAALSRNANLTPELAKKIYTAYKYDDNVRHKLSKNKNTPKECLRDMVCDEWFVVLGVAENPNTDPDDLIRLASSSWPGVFRALARNPSFPDDCFSLLANRLDCASLEEAAKRRGIGFATLPVKVVKTL